MSNKTLLVLAASLYQLQTIKTAKRLGYRVVTTDNVPSNPGHALADKSYSCDTVDVDAVLDIARTEKVDGVIAACTDIALVTAAHVAAQMQVAGIPIDVATTVSSKTYFRAYLKSQGLPAPESTEIDGSSVVDGKLFELGSWTMKPDRSSGSKGVFIINCEPDFYERLPQTLQFSPNGKGILERFIDGFQGTCEGVLSGGEITLACVLDRQTVNPPFVTTCGHHVPSRLPSHIHDKLLSRLQHLFQLLGVTDTPFDCDFVVDREEIYILEISPRIGGNSIATLLKKAIGFDIVEYSVKLACGDQPERPRLPQIEPTAIVLLGMTEEGNLFYDTSEADALRKQSWLDSLVFDKAVGQPVSPFINGRHRIGEAIVRGRDRDELDANVIELKQRLGILAL